MSNNNKITVKVFFNGDIRRAPFSTEGSFDDLQDLVNKLFKVDKAKITYKDEEGDKVLILNDDEVQEAIADARSQGKGKTLRLYVEKADDAKVVNVTIESPKNAAAPSAPSAVSEDIDAEAFEVVNTVDIDAKADNPYPDVGAAWKAEKAQKKSEKAAAKAWRKAAKAQYKTEKAQAKQQAKEERKRFKEERKRCKEEHCGRRWRHEGREQRREARNEARKQFCDEIRSFLEDEKIIKAIQESLPVVADLLVNEEKNLSEIIDVVLESQPALKNHALVQRILPMARSILGFLPTGIIGPVLLDIVLDLQDLFKDGKPDMPIHRLFKRMLRSIKQSTRRNTPNVHHGVVCDMCPEDSGPIVGKRWKKNGENYDLCQECFNKLSDEEKKEYREVEVHGWRPPCAFGIPGFHPGAFAFMNMFGGGRPCGGFGGLFRGPPHHPPRHRHRHPQGPHGYGPFGGGPFGGGPFGRFPAGRGGPHNRPQHRGYDRAPTQPDTENDGPWEQTKEDSGESV